MDGAQDSGDMAGAWDCYRAILRMYAHLRRRERLKIACVPTSMHGELQQRLAKWAADPRTTIPQLRRALEEVVACRPRPEWDAFTLKREYLDLMQFLDGPVNPPSEQIEEELTYRLGECQLPADLMATAPRHQRAARPRARTQPPRHPITLCQLAGTCGEPRPAATPAGGAKALLTSHSGRPALRSILSAPTHRPAPAAVTAGGGKLAGHDQRCQSGLPVSAGKGALWPAVRQREQRGYRELLVLLASELYHRERGTLPPSEDALVGTYLESLPDDGSAELADETTPTVE